jgi:hypothetical protein
MVPPTSITGTTPYTVADIGGMPRRREMLKIVPGLKIRGMNVYLEVPDEQVHSGTFERACEYIERKLMKEAWRDWADTYSEVDAELLNKLRAGVIAAREETRIALGYYMALANEENDDGRKADQDV